MHDLTNQSKKHHKRFAKEKTDLLRWLDMSGVKDGNTKNRLSSIFKVTVIAMLFLSVALNMVRTLQKMARKICFDV